VPGSDGDHNNVKTDEFNRRNCVLLIEATKKSTKIMACGKLAAGGRKNVPAGERYSAQLAAGRAG